MILQINDLNMYYNRLQVLKNLNIELNNCNSIAIIGASGCGKSTLLRLLAGIEYPASGSISINRLEINQSTLRQYQQHIGFVFQDHNLFPHLSLKENITLILEKCRHETPEFADQRANDLLESLQLTEQADKLPRHVSGGQLQRASIARALSTDPDILLLDEPTASLDPILTHEVLKSIETLKNSGKDFIFVTHEIAFVQHFADYYIFLDQGEIIEHNPIGALINPTTPELTNFMQRVSY